MGDRGPIAHIVINESDSAPGLLVSLLLIRLCCLVSIWTWRTLAVVDSCILVLAVPK